LTFYNDYAKLYEMSEKINTGSYERLSDKKSADLVREKLLASSEVYKNDIILPPGTVSVNLDPKDQSRVRQQVLRATHRTRDAHAPSYEAPATDMPVSESAREPETKAPLAIESAEALSNT